tara:strand:+ start:11892 stop:12713 length:822 start_codon:yes stop_codon:yes gene_type:complete
MDAQKNISKILRQIRLGDLSIDPNYVFHSKQGEVNTLALEISLKEDGLQGTFSAINKGENFPLIDGQRRHPILMDLHGPELMVYVWVYEGDLTEEEINKQILAIGKTRNISTRDVTNEFDVWDGVFPSNQGKKDGSNGRIQEIAQRIGVSTSKLNKLLRIRRADPDLLRQIDVEDTSFTSAFNKCLKTEKDKKEEEARNEVVVDGQSELTEQEVAGGEKEKYRDKDVDLDKLPTCCPTCNRSFDSITPEEIPSIFNVDRKEENNQTTWMQKTA